MKGRREEVAAAEKFYTDMKTDRDHFKKLAGELAEALEGMWEQFAYTTGQGKVTGGLSALEDAEQALANFRESQGERE